MIFCEELDQKIPKGWEAEPISQFCTINSSKRIFQSEYVSEGIPFYRGQEITLKKQGQPIINTLYIRQSRYMDIIEENGKPEKGDILLTAVGTLGVSYLVQDEEFYFKDGNIIWLKNFKEKSFGLYIYDYMQSNLFTNMIEEITIGSTQNAITIVTLGEQKIVLPSKKVLCEFYDISFPIQEKINFSKGLNISMTEKVA